MREELIGFQVAKLARVKGFDWRAANNYGFLTGILYDDPVINDLAEEIPTWIAAPTQSLLQRWLREVHNIHIRVEYNNPFYIGCFLIPDYKTRYNLATRTSETYEDALEKVLIKALKEIKL